MSKSHALHLVSPDIPPRRCTTTFINSKYTCDGTDTQPRFAWCKKGIPKGTKSLTIIVDDPDAIPVVGSVFTHFAVTDIPPTVSKLSEFDLQGTVMKNDFGSYGWGGPCPPPGDPPHKYRFVLYTLDITTNLPPATKLTAEIFERLFACNILAKSQFVAFYQRPAPCPPVKVETVVKKVKKVKSCCKK